MDCKGGGLIYYACFGVSCRETLSPLLGVPAEFGIGPRAARLRQNEPEGVAAAQTNDGGAERIRDEPPDRFEDSHGAFLVVKLRAMSDQEKVAE